MASKSDPYHPYKDRFTNPQGPGDARPTAMDIIADEDLHGKLTGHVILITGAASGIGIETARALHATGATLYLAVRDVAKGEQVADDVLRSSSDQSAIIKVLPCDLSSLSSVRACAHAFLAQNSTLNILVNNAGIMAVPTRTITTDAHELQFATNYLGHFLLFALLRPALLAAAAASPAFDSRVINVSSLGHRASTLQFADLAFTNGQYTPFGAYGQIKTALIWMANSIQRRYAKHGLTANSLNPGGISTGLQKHMPRETLERFAGDEGVRRSMLSVEQGAATTVWAAVGRVWKGDGGRYLEECGVAERASGNTPYTGFAQHAFDEEGEERLWRISFGLVGVEDDD
ncbi:putative short-chain dehydrogenase [Pseudovirgaria hyperparasitica]|uniref:Short-chain dehydrogenase n=1 Tax=Pseudovirgaria hyperparasitica TaxID=470096 RepID=A0A6A6W1D0_9PEZI|nr:putative short-chain dehydrogenase [Pseudovirgaria hyperparasitica]KAF2755939.1 putative short-chain dehydrogenase [Pseudovirgaria hyperparasitica]